MNENIYGIESMLPMRSGRTENYLYELTREIERVIEGINIELNENSTAIADVQPEIQTETFDVHVEKRGKTVIIDWNIHPENELSAGEYQTLFTLPPKFRPKQTLYDNIVLSSGTVAQRRIEANGRFAIRPQSTEISWIRGATIYFTE